jgi:hypothetical protein
MRGLLKHTVQPSYQKKSFYGNSYDTPKTVTLITRLGVVRLAERFDEHGLYHVRGARASRKTLRMHHKYRTYGVYLPY